MSQVKGTSEQLAVYSSEHYATAEQTSEASEVATGTEDQVRTVVETSNTVQSIVGQIQIIGNNSMKVNEAAK